MKRLLCLVFAVVPAVVFAADPVTVLSGLDNPTGVAIQPETGHVFVADSAAGKVIRLVDGKAEDVIVGSPTDIYGKGPMYNIGPLGIAFLDKDTLVVADGGFVDGKEIVRTFAVPAIGASPAKYDADEKSKTNAIEGSGEGESAIKPEGNLYGIVVTKTAAYVTCNGDDTKGWISKVDIDGTKLGKLERFIATKESTEVDAPVAIALNPKSGDLVVGQMGEINKPKDGLVTFYNAKTGKMLLNLEAGLYDLTGLAYSPKTGLLYGTDFAWMAEKEGGLFRIDADLKDGAQSIKTVKIASLDKATAMAFAPDGTLYITVIGSAKEGSDAKPGQLLKIAPGL